MFQHPKLTAAHAPLPRFSSNRWILFAAWCVPLLSGCGGEPDHSAELAFPSRTDRLVLKVPEQAPPRPSQPGQLDQELAALDGLGGITAEPLRLPHASRAAVDETLRELFGTPACPTIQLQHPAKDAWHLDDSSLAEGKRLYHRHRCLQCHNLTGDGRGGAGLWVIPYPRDFRRGMFKFSTAGGHPKPRRGDLFRTLTEGLKGTAMPSFALLSEQDRHHLVSYVVYLSTRGQVEFETLAALLAGESIDIPTFARQKALAVLDQWQAAEQARALPAEPDDGPPGSPARQDAIRRGYALFTASGESSCVQCHRDFGRDPQLRYDVWGTVARPANLTEAPLKSNPGPQQLYARIRWGIPAVGMPARPELTERQVWDLVRLVQALPYPRELPPEIRSAVYPSRELP